MKSSALDLSVQALGTSSSKCDIVSDLVEQSVKMMKQTSAYLEQHTALSSPSMESCPLSEIPGYLPILRGCVVQKINDNLMHWKKNRTVLCSAAADVVRQCSAVDTAYRAGRPALSSDQLDPCCPRPHTLLETVHDCRDAFSQLQHILLMEEEDLSDSADEEIPNILQDLKEVQAILRACKERLQVCQPVLVSREDDGGDGPSGDTCAAVDPRVPSEPLCCLS